MELTALSFLSITHLALPAERQKFCCPFYPSLALYFILPLMSSSEYHKAATFIAYVMLQDFNAVTR